MITERTWQANNFFEAFGYEDGIQFNFSTARFASAINKIESQ
jgi:hypothetical protein